MVLASASVQLVISLTSCKSWMESRGHTMNWDKRTRKIQKGQKTTSNHYRSHNGDAALWHNMAFCMSSEPLFVSFNSAWREPICFWISVKACRWCSKAGKWMLQQENGTWWLEHARTLTSNRSGAVFGATQQQNNLPAANLLCSLQRSLNLSQCQWSSRQVLATPLQGRSQRKRSGTGPRTMGHLKWFCRFCSTRVCLCTSRTQIQINALSIMKQNTSNH